MMLLRVYGTFLGKQVHHQNCKCKMFFTAHIAGKKMLFVVVSLVKISRDFGMERAHPVSDTSNTPGMAAPLSSELGHCIGAPSDTCLALLIPFLCFNAAVSFWVSGAGAGAGSLRLERAV